VEYVISRVIVILDYYFFHLLINIFFVGNIANNTGIYSPNHRIRLPMRKQCRMEMLLKNY